MKLSDIARHCYLCGGELTEEQKRRGIMYHSKSQGKCYFGARFEHYDRSDRFCMMCGKKRVNMTQNVHNHLNNVCEDCIYEVRKILYPKKYGDKERKTKSKHDQPKQNASSKPFGVKYSDFGSISKDNDRRNILLKQIKNKNIVRLALEHGRRPSLFIKVPCNDDDNACIKCALYDLETACRNYDCTGHYLKEPNNATISEITTTSI